MTFSEWSFQSTRTPHAWGCGKELSEDEELNDYIDAELPGLINPTERSFDFVEAEVCTQLSHLSHMKQDAMASLLETHEPTVFETRTIPRLAPHRQWDLDITEEEGARPMAARPYPVAPQHLPGLNLQIAALEKAGIICRSRNLNGALVLFAPKKDGKLRLCIDYRKLNRQTLRECYRPRPHCTHKGSPHVFETRPPESL